MTKVLEDPRLKVPRGAIKLTDPQARQRVTIYLTAQELRDAKIVSAQMGLHLANLGREAMRRLIYVNPAADAEMGGERD